MSEAFTEQIARIGRQYLNCDVSDHKQNLLAAIIECDRVKTPEAQGIKMLLVDILRKTI